MSIDFLVACFVAVNVMRTGVCSFGQVTPAGNSIFTPELITAVSDGRLDVVNLDDTGYF